MKTWYAAVCDDCSDAIQMFVDTPSRTALYLSEYDQRIYEFMMDHYGCRLRLIHSDQEWDELYDSEWERIYSHETAMGLGMWMRVTK